MRNRNGRRNEVGSRMNDNEVGEIQDIIGQLGDIEGSLECAERLYKLIKPYLDEEQTR